MANDGLTLPDLPAAVRRLEEEFTALDPEALRGPGLTFARIARKYPHVGRERLASLPRVPVHAFSGLGYCPYKAWHLGAATPEVRSAESAASLERGSHVHAKAERVDLEAARRARPATVPQLRDVSVDLIQLPFVGAHIRVGGLVYMGQMDRVGRAAGNLVVEEIKSSRWTRMADHYLQTFAYCMLAPTAVRRLAPKLQAKEVLWKLSYPVVSQDYGPYPFTEKLLRLELDAMKAFEVLYMAGVGRVPVVPGLPGPHLRKCAPCLYFSGCPHRLVN